MENKANARRGHIIRCVVATVCVICLVVSGYAIVNDLVGSQQRAQKKQDLMSLYGGSDSGAEETSSAGSLLDYLFPSALADGVAVQEDFMELYNINPDLVGILDMGSSIHELIVQRDNTFYLKHDFYGDADDAGTLFANEANTLFPERDQNILLHGHNMRDDSVLGSMDKFRDAQWLHDNPIFYLRLIDEPAQKAYVPIAFFDASVNMGDAHFFDIHIEFDEQRFEQFIGDAKAKSIYDIPVDVTMDDQLLTVVTCSYTYNNSRFIMVARQLRDDETVEDMTALVQAAVQ